MRVVQVMTLADDGSVSMQMWEPPDGWEVPADWHAQPMEAFLPSLPEMTMEMASAPIEAMGGVVRESFD